ncbi:hypothetical protein VTP01DRAFT_6862 [Rhizomucor pusillus]|uniref:uncharacterized protein n=1 Tax=Rhizomucor pusillus TaxID=4840 RepID=UPI0037437A21
MLLAFKKERKKELAKAAEVICKHCGEKGHKMKTNRKCKLYTDSGNGEHVYGISFIPRINDVLVGKKMKQTDTENEEEKQRKKKGRTNANENTKPCPRCGSTSHSRSTLKDCPYHVQTSEEILVSRFGRNFERYARTISLSGIVKEDYQEQLQQGIQQLSSFIRNGIVRVMVFVNFYIVEHAHNAIPAYVFSQTFFYSVSQLVMDMEITNTNDKMPNDIRDCWDRFKTQYPSAIFTQASIRGYATPLARACQTLQTTYSNMIVEHFQDRVEKIRHIQAPKTYTTNEYIYEDLAGGNPTIPEELQEDCDLDIILAIRTIQISPKDYIPEPCTTTEMAANPGRFIPALRFILSQYTLEHEQGNEKTCKTLPKLFALTPQPSLHWRFVDIDAATLATLLLLGTPVTHQQKMQRRQISMLQHTFILIQCRHIFSLSIAADIHATVRDGNQFKTAAILQTTLQNFLQV